jgi:hypothetical protein
MKFFTKELWLDAQNTNRTSELHLREKAASDAYRAQLDTLRSRLSNEAFQFFCSADVHDGELLKLAIVDGSRPAPLSEAVRPWTTPRNHPVKVKLAILDASDRHVWRLLYKTVRRVVVDYPTEHPLFYQNGNGFGDLGYHELTDAGGGFLRHEILFATGAVLLFEFAEVEVGFAPRSVAEPDL